MFPLPDGQPLVAHSLRPYLQTGEPIMLVVHPEHLLFQQWLNQQGIPFTCCPDAESGMGHSLRWGIQKTADWPWWGIALADMPWLDKQILSQLAGSVREDRISVPVFGGLQGHPVIFGKQFAPQLMVSSGDKGAKNLLQTYAHCIEQVEIGSSAILMDVDTPQALEAYLRIHFSQ